MGPFWRCSLTMCFSLSICGMQRVEKKTKNAWTQVGDQMIWDDNGDDENGHGEEWRENPLFITKYWNRLIIRK